MEAGGITWCPSQPGGHLLSIQQNLPLHIRHAKASNSGMNDNAKAPLTKCEILTKRAQRYRRSHAGRRCGNVPAVALEQIVEPSEGTGGKVSALFGRGAGC
jgi:hypothetical protein